MAEYNRGWGDAILAAIRIIEDETQGGDYGVGSLDGSSVEGLREKLLALAPAAPPVAGPVCAKCNMDGGDGEIWDRDSQCFYSCSDCRTPDEAEPLTTAATTAAPSSNHSEG